MAGLAGAVAATLGVVVPSFVVIYAISMFLDRFLEIEVIANAFRGIKLAVGLLILHAGINMLKSIPKAPLPRAILTGSLIAMLVIELFSLNFSTISLMLAAGTVSLACTALSRKGGAQP